MELLTHKIDMVVDYQLWKPIRLSTHGPAFSHLFFADDIIRTSTTSTRNCHAIIDILNEFNRVSGQKINFTKLKFLFQKCFLPGQEFYSLILQHA